MYVDACRLPGTLKSSPVGSITFELIKLPDYITSTPPIKIFAYSDADRQDLVIDDPNGVGLQAKQMIPGLFTELLFKPSNFYAFSDNVSYTIFAKPQHDMSPTSRIVIEMPPTLIFDQSKGCTVALTIATCELDASTNTVTLTNIFDEKFEGGNILKFIIVKATNPSGAREAGPWSIRSESIFDGEYFVVDGFSSAESFYARSGTIESDVDYLNTLTFASGNTIDLDLSTEHNIPDEGYIKITLPKEMAFDEQVVAIQELVFVNDKLTFVNVTENSALFKLQSGHDFDNNPIEISLQGIRNPRSFAPTSGFVIQTMDKLGYIIDAGGQDLNVVMNEKNELKNIRFVPSDTTNGAITTYQVHMDSFVHLESGDIVFITFPPELPLSDKT